MSPDTPKHPPSPLDPGGAEPPVAPTPKIDVTDNAAEAVDDAGDEGAPERSEQKGGMIGEG